MITGFYLWKEPNCYWQLPSNTLELNFTENVTNDQELPCFPGPSCISTILSHLSQALPPVSAPFISSLSSLWSWPLIETSASAEYTEGFSLSLSPLPAQLGPCLFHPFLSTGWVPLISLTLVHNAVFSKKIYDHQGNPTKITISPHTHHNGYYSKTTKQNGK